MNRFTMHARLKCLSALASIKIGDQLI